MEHARPEGMALGQPARSGSPGVVCIGSSTGGIEALCTVLRAFGPLCLPTLIVQHISDAFAPALARRLQQHCAARVLPAADGEYLVPGEVRVAPGLGKHLVIGAERRVRTQLVDGAPGRELHCPSVDQLFRSAARSRHQVLAALLTGMGRDGADGMLMIRRAGGHTIAQNEGTSVVFGMPRAAIDLGAAEQVLPLNAIGPRLMRLSNAVTGMGQS